MVGRYSRSYQHESDQTAGGSGRQKCLACSGPGGHEESDTTKQLNNNNLKHPPPKEQESYLCISFPSSLPKDGLWEHPASANPSVESIASLKGGVLCMGLYASGIMDAGGAWIPLFQRSHQPLDPRKWVKPLNFGDYLILYWIVRGNRHIIKRLTAF
ncbi:Hypothetical predicted protein [Podarcis lilfordi]|uniref:Uncharacterized protein n=1 Tax=Podarcis lilfordi TaxID=74358 RepID=A0AA35P3P2_9SAUR|nr:Hypothetical predicted protein [Podarcis lilfordi]